MRVEMCICSGAIMASIAIVGTPKKSKRTSQFIYTKLLMEKPFFCDFFFKHETCKLNSSLTSTIGNEGSTEKEEKNIIFVNASRPLYLVGWPD